MIIKELIEELKKYDGNMNVFYGCDCGCGPDPLNSIDELVSINTYDGIEKELWIYF